MQFMVTYSIDVSNRAAAEARFLETGAMPPDGVKLLGRWHCPGNRSGFMVVESADIATVMKFLRDWSDVMTLQVSPVISDEQLAGIMQA